MGTAEEDYAEAERQIEKALRDRGTLLNLKNFENLKTLPPAIRQLRDLQVLTLNNTQVVDISPLKDLTALRSLYIYYTQVVDISPLKDLTALKGLSLNNTQVADISPLKNLTALQSLGLNNTQVADISPLKDLTALQRLDLDNTQVADISPLKNLTALQDLALDNTQVADLRPALAIPIPEGASPLYFGLRFKNTPATRASKKLAELAEIENDRDRTRQTLDYLRTLPPWPEPLPWDVSNTDDKSTASDEPKVPQNITSPITVVETNDQLRLIRPEGDTDPDGALMARQGWQSIKDYMDDLADQRGRIDNALPRLGKAMDRLTDALGADFEHLNAIATGTHGNRVIRLSRHAQNALMDEDADDIEEFAAALTLFLERFPEWRAYRDAALADAIPPDDAEAAADLSDTFAESLEDQDEIDPAIPAVIEEQSEAVREDPEDRITSRGLVASVSHVASSLASFALPVLKWAKQEAVDLAKLTWSGLKKAAAGAIVAGSLALAAKATGILTAVAPTLHQLAARYPQLLDWVTKFLNFFGL
ncbi:MAG: leucine-rich repeat domain-containing protein [Pseudomonadota bacterium]